jgi:hypothetical protein
MGKIPETFDKEREFTSLLHEMMTPSAFFRIKWRT